MGNICFRKKKKGLKENNTKENKISNKSEQKGKLSIKRVSKEKRFVNQFLMKILFCFNFQILFDIELSRAFLEISTHVLFKMIY
jgi:hypothetical protein